jgi:hypothetical protein
MAKRASKKSSPEPSMMSGIASAMMEKLHALDAQRSAIMDGAMSEAMKAAKSAVAALNSLGLNYQLVKAAKGRAAKAGSRVGTRTTKDGPCPICGFKTSPLHDGRTHRSQKTKKPFTAAELEAKGLKKA